MNEKELAELDLAVANAIKVWKIAHQWHPTFTLDPTFSGAEIHGDMCMLVPNNVMRQGPKPYQPSTDNAEAMRLVAEYGLSLYPSFEIESEPHRLLHWVAVLETGEFRQNRTGFTAPTPNIAICKAILGLMKA